MLKEKNVDVLLDTPIWQLSGREFCELVQFANSLHDGQCIATETKRTLVYGVQALADALACSPSTIYALMRTPRTEDGSAEGGGVLRDAIVSRIGRRIVFDVELARTFATTNQTDRRNQRD